MRQSTSRKAPILFSAAGVFFWLTIAVPSTVRAQAQPSYDSLWKRVAALSEQRGLVRSALSLSNDIYVRARYERDDPQAIRALLFIVRLDQPTMEDADTANIRLLQNSIDSFPQPGKAILQSITAQAYWNYFQNRRYRIYERTATDEPRSTDINTWNQKDFQKVIDSLFEASVSDPKRLQETGLKNYEPILFPGNSRYLRPTLYDLLAFRALAFFTNTEAGLTKSIRAFTLDDSAIFAPSDVFIKHRFATPDSTAPEWKALLLYQDVLRFHKNDDSAQATVDADLDRLTFARNNASIENVDRLYEASLKTLIDAHRGQRAVSQALYQLAAFMEEKGRGYVPGNHDTSFKWNLRSCVRVCDSIAKLYPGTEGAMNAIAAAAKLRENYLNLTVSAVNLPKKPFLVLVNYGNIHQVHFRLFSLTPRVGSIVKSNSRYDSLSIKKLRAILPLRSWVQDLPDPGDYRSHQAEVKIDGLPIGSYELIGSEEDISADSCHSILGLRLDISNIGWVLTANQTFFVMNRENGKPIPGADVDIKEASGKLQELHFITDSSGRFSLKGWPAYTMYAAMIIKISTPGDHLSSGNSIFLRTTYQEHPDSSKPSLFFFTDRAIYRPGQIVYFKAIGVWRGDKGNSLYRPGKAIQFYLRDYSGSKIDSLPLQPNDYGSVHGQFRLPLSRASGGYSIETDISPDNTDLKVEEYKRPRFYVQFDTLKNRFRLLDTISFRAVAKAYAGNAIEGAKVNYLIRRVTRFPGFLSEFGGRFVPRFGNSKVIATGTALTADDGSFQVRFPANPDLTINKEEDPYFIFEITADVTDISGETHSGASSVSIGYKSLLLSLDLPTDGKILSTDLHGLRIVTTNLTGVPQQTAVKISIIRLTSPSRLLRPRYWEAPDQFTLGEAEFHAQFPNDEYDHERDFARWPVQSTVVSDSFRSATGAIFPLNPAKFTSGVYRIDAIATDSDGQPVRTSQFLQVLNPIEGKLPFPSYLWDVSEQTSDKGIVRYWVGSSARQPHIIQEIASIRYQKVTHQVLKGSSYLDTLTYKPIIGGAFGMWGFITDNRIFSDTFTLPDAFHQDSLDVKTSSLADKIEPGSVQRLTIYVKAPWKDKTRAEVLASMYDASLDQFRVAPWAVPDMGPLESPFMIEWKSNDFGTGETVRMQYNNQSSLSPYRKYYDEIIDKVIDEYAPLAVMLYLQSTADSVIISREWFVRRPDTRMMMAAPAPGNVTLRSRVSAQSLQSKFELENSSSAASSLPAIGSTVISTVTLRKNFNETAFFYPDLRTDSAGNVSFSFTAPEAVTKWKLQVLAHTKDLAFGLTSAEVVTRKTLMLQPNLPRFLREGDKIVFNTKIASLDSASLHGNARLSVLDAASGKDIDESFRNTQSSQAFSISPNSSVSVKFPLSVPLGMTQPVTYHLEAEAGNFTDGEEGDIPVLSKRILVTDAHPLLLKGDTTIHIKLENIGKEKIATPYRLTLECSSNPAWYALQSLPFLNQSRNECASAVFQRYYAAVMGGGIISSIPNLRSVVAAWQKDTSSTSPLDKDPDLKSFLLEETPWVLDAAGERASLKRLGNFLEIENLKNEQESALNTLTALQGYSGAFSWFKGGYDDRYMTQEILVGLGHLDHLQFLSKDAKTRLLPIERKSLIYLDGLIWKDYVSDRKAKSPVAGYDEIQYLYMRSFFPGMPYKDSSATAATFYRKLISAAWQDQSKYTQGMIALICFRSGDKTTAQAILASLAENSIYSPDKGRYWKDNTGGWYWYEAPVETQSLLIEAFREIGSDPAFVDELRFWLLTQKQTQAWPTTSGTADACYALLLGGRDWLSSAPSIRATIGDSLLNLGTGVAGTAYVKKQWEGMELRPAMGKIEIQSFSSPTPNSSVPTSTGISPAAWGAVYYQYFQDMDSVTAAGTSSLSVQKQLYVVNGPALGSSSSMRRLGSGDSLHVGDRVRVQLIVRSDRDMDYVHLKDLRAACMEPVDVISTYRWQGGLGYYQSTLDLSTNFYFSHLRKGTFVLEYDMFASQVGSFSGGMATLQCLYAPQFASRSEGVSIQVKD